MRFVSLLKFVYAAAALLVVQIPCPAAASQESTVSVRVGPQVQAAKLVKKVSPVYPEEAKRKNLRGTVRLTIKVGPDGRVTSAKLASGDRLLAGAAKEAVLKWQYKPTLLKGRPVEVTTQVDIRFPEDTGHGVVGGVPRDRPQL